MSTGDLPTPENTIFFELHPASKAFLNSPPETISIPKPSFTRIFNKFKFELALTEKHIKPSTFFKPDFRVLTFSIIFLLE